MGICELCGKYLPLEKHHLMNGVGMRKKAEEDGLYIWICRPDHEELHHDYQKRYEQKQKAQRIYLKNHTQEEWMKRYHKNYL